MNIFLKEISSDKELVIYNSIAKEVGSIFDQLEWIQLFNNHKICGIYRENGILIGGFSYNIIYIKKIPVISSFPFINRISLFFFNEAENKARSHTYEKNVMYAVMDYLKKHPVKTIQISFPPNFKDFQPFIWNHFQVKVRYTYRIDLKQDLKSITDNVSFNRRKKINRAIRENLNIQPINDIYSFEKLIINIIEKERINYDKSELSSFLHQFCKSNNTFGLIVSKNEIPLASYLSVFDQCTAYSILGSQYTDKQDNNASTLCLFESIKHAKSLGLSYFDFEGSMIPKIESVFREFGGDLTPYFQVIRTSFFIKIIDKLLGKNRF